MRKFILTLTEVVSDDENDNDIKKRTLKYCEIFPISEKIFKPNKLTKDERIYYEHCFRELQQSLYYMEQCFTNPKGRETLNKIPWLDIKQGE